MKLLIDAGNTRIKWAFSHDGTWSEIYTHPTADIASLHLSSSATPNSIWISNVAGATVQQQLQNSCQIWQIAPNFICAQTKQCGVSNSYDHPQRLGCDRWASLIAAWHLYRSPALVVTCGTATTIDSLSAEGEFLGGLILPGLTLMQRSLLNATQLELAEIGQYQALPRNTLDAVLSGALMAQCGAIEKQYAKLQYAHAQVLLSGGAANMLQPYLNIRARVIDNLVLQGLWQISQTHHAN